MGRRVARESRRIYLLSRQSPIHTVRFRPTWSGGTIVAKAAQRETEYSENERVILWRYEHLVELGFAPQDAVQLVEIPDVRDGATKLVEAGCPIPIALDLLKAE